MIGLERPSHFILAVSSVTPNHVAWIMYGLEPPSHFILLVLGSLGGLAACLVHRRMSGWLWVLASGFGGVLTGCVLVFLMFIPAKSDVDTVVGVRNCLEIASTIRGLGFVVITIGVAGMLTSLRDKILRSQPPAPPDDPLRPARLPDPDDLRPFKGHEDRHDIQR